MMRSLFYRVGIMTRPETPEIEAYLTQLVDFLRTQNITVYIDQACIDEGLLPSEKHHEVTFLSKDNLVQNCDLIIVMGGDGTFLSAARQVAPYRVPLVGINLGHLGFLSQVSCEKMLCQLNEILLGQYLCEECTIVEAQVFRFGEPIFHHLALNDVVLSRGLAGKMIEFEVFINQNFVYRQRSDGLIVSTPTGSTAYALAAGGPILQSGLKAFTLVPVCPQSMTNRPIVIGADCEIEILVTKAEDARVHYDGQIYVDIQTMDHILLRRYRHPVRVIHPLDSEYYRTLRQKLHWGEQLV